MPFFFGRAVDGRVVIEGEDARHLARSLRARAGEVIDVVDPGGWLLQVRLSAVGGQRVEGVVESSVPHLVEPRLQVTVGLAMLPSAALEAALARCVELGAAQFLLVAAERSVGRALRPERWVAICREAAMLAGRLVVPSVIEPRPLRSVVEGAVRPVLLDRGARARLASLALGSACTLLIGPEGGWTAAELGVVREQASLGPRNLRAENAAAAAVAVSLAVAGDL